MDYITTGIMNETKYILSLNHKSDFSVIKLLINKGDKIKTIQLKREDTMNNNFKAVKDSLRELVLIYQNEYGEEYDLDRGFRLI